MLLLILNEIQWLSTKEVTKVQATIFCTLQVVYSYIRCKGVCLSLIDYFIICVFVNLHASESTDLHFRTICFLFVWIYMKNHTSLPVKQLNFCEHEGLDHMMLT